MFNESDFGSVDGCWYSIFALHHTNTIGEVQEFNMQDPAIQGELHFTSEDLDRVMARAEEMATWLGQFESSSGNPLAVIAVVAAWPEGDTQTFPRLVTTSWRGWNGANDSARREAALQLLGRFQGAPLESPILQGVEIWDAADEALRTVFLSSKSD
jgi:hypothetical protein